MIDDQLDAIEESLTNTIESMSRFLEDYAVSHNSFQKRGMDEGISVLKNSEDVDDGIANINKKISNWESKEKGDLMPEDQRKDIISGLNDLIAAIS
jgi:hypothetical protein